MKKGIFVILSLILILLIVLVGSSALVYAGLGEEGFEAYSLALQSIVALAQHGMENIVAIVAQSGNTVVSLFNAATK